MIELDELKIDGKSAVGIKVIMPDAPPLIMIRASKGVLFCGYLNPDAADNFGLAAAIVRGVSTVDEALEKPVVHATKKAEEMGIKIGMSGRDALRLFLQ